MVKRPLVVAWLHLRLWHLAWSVDGLLKGRKYETFAQAMSTAEFYGLSYPEDFEWPWEAQR
jgi:hypothetical protein